jgi:hypothetical protein
VREDAHFDIATIGDERCADVARWSSCAWGFCHALATDGDDASCFVASCLPVSLESCSLKLALESFETAGSE